MNKNGFGLQNIRKSLAMQIIGLNVIPGSRIQDRDSKMEKGKPNKDIMEKATPQAIN
jgi:hypothetical protein